MFKIEWGCVGDLSQGNKKVIIKAQKVARYFVANSGYTFLKLKTEKDSQGNEIVISKSHLRKGWQCIDSNIVDNEDAFNYDINRQHYIEEAYKIINLVEPKNTYIGLFN